MQSVWVQEEFLESWHFDRMEMARENSYSGKQKSLAAFHRTLFLDNTVKAVGADTLAQAYEQYQLLLAERARLVEEKTLSDTGGPFQLCPACHKRPKGAAGDSGQICRAWIHSEISGGEVRMQQ